MTKNSALHARVDMMSLNWSRIHCQPYNIQIRRTLFQKWDMSLSYCIMLKNCIHYIMYSEFLDLDLRI